MSLILKVKAFPSRRPTNWIANMLLVISHSKIKSLTFDRPLVRLKRRGAEPNESNWFASNGSSKVASQPRIESNQPANSRPAHDVSCGCGCSSVSFTPLTSSWTRVTSYSSKSLLLQTLFQSRHTKTPIHIPNMPEISTHGFLQQDPSKIRNARPKRAGCWLQASVFRVRP